MWEEHKAWLKSKIEDIRQKQSSSANAMCKGWYSSIAEDYQKCLDHMEQLESENIE